MPNSSNATTTAADEVKLATNKNITANNSPESIKLGNKEAATADSVGPGPTTTNSPKKVTINSNIPSISLAENNIGYLSDLSDKSPKISNKDTKDKKGIPFGGFSFESESLPDFSEFEENTSGDSTDGHSTSKNTPEIKRPSDGQMAPTTTIETVTISRPLKVIAFICGLFACLLLVMGLASSEWLIEPAGYRQGLFVYCLPPNLPSNITVPFVDNNNPELITEGCHRLDLAEQAYTLVAAAFVVVSLLVNVFATLLTVLGLRCRDPNNKYKYYRIAVYVMALALVAILVSLVVYPVCFANIMERSNRPYWEFGWAYGVAWGAAIFLLGGVILLLCDKESEEIYYKERTIVQYADSNNKV